MRNGTVRLFTPQQEAAEAAQAEVLAKIELLDEALQAMASPPGSNPQMDQRDLHIRITDRRIYVAFEGRRAEWETRSNLFAVAHALRSMIPAPERGGI
jgi:hypothetical protein